MGYGFKRSRPGGFTMFEILVVMALIGIIAALIAPRVGGAIENMRLKSAVRQCSAVLRYARSISITSQQGQKVHFVLKGGTEGQDSYRYLKISQETRDNAVDKETQKVGPPELKREEKTVTLLKEISLSWKNEPDGAWEDEGAYEVIFTSRGFTSGGSMRFALARDEKRSFVLTIDPITGRVKTSQGEG